jgi:hypothetical protein
MRRYAPWTMLLVLLVLLSSESSARASSSSLPGVRCSGNGPSALNQYCEDIPSSTGAGQAAPGLPALATTLRRRSVRALSAATSRRNAARRGSLLTLPAPGSRGLIRSGPDPHPDGWALFSGLIGVIVAVAFALATVALLRRRRATSA